jgi:hypothetical protein
MNASMSSRPACFQLDASGREEPSGKPERVKVGLDRAAGLVLDSKVQLEGAHQVGYAGVESAGM